MLDLPIDSKLRSCDLVKMRSATSSLVAMSEPGDRRTGENQQADGVCVDGLPEWQSQVGSDAVIIMILQ